jgi:hypothetical protein
MLAHVAIGHRICRLLRPSRERPGRRTIGKTDEFALSHIPPHAKELL